MKVKNIMFSGIMAAILAGPALAADPVVATVASTGYVDAKVGVNAAAIAENTAAIEQNATDIAKKANADDVYTKDLVYTKTEADDKFEEQSDAIAKLTEAKAYTDTQVQALTDSLGGTGEDGESTGLTGVVLEHTSQITALEDKVGTTKVADQISNALSALTTGDGAVAQNTADIAAINNAETGLLKQAKDYADGLAANYETAGAAATAKSEAIAEAKAYTDTEVGNVNAKFTSYTDTAGMNAAIKAVDDKFASYTTTEGLNTKLSEYALLTSLEAEETARKEAVKAVSDNLANYATTATLTEELGKKQDDLSDTQMLAVNSGIDADKVAAYDNYATTKQDVLSGTGYVTINQENKTVSVTADGAVAAGNTGLVTGGTVYTYALPKPTDCTEAKCVLSVDGNGAPYWMKLELAPVTVEE